MSLSKSATVFEFALSAQTIQAFHAARVERDPDFHAKHAGAAPVVASVIFYRVVFASAVPWCYQAAEVFQRGPDATGKDAWLPVSRFGEYPSEHQIVSLLARSLAMNLHARRRSMPMSIESSELPNGALLVDLGVL